MQTYPNYNPAFTQPYYNPMMNAQQRLSSLEQQFPQFAPQPILKGRPVSSFDEAKAAMVDLDGTPTYFVDSANNSIYCKQINLDGTASMYIYKKVEDKVAEEDVAPVMKDEFTVAITGLQEQINNIMEVLENDKSNANVQRKRQPIRTDAE